MENDEIRARVDREVLVGTIVAGVAIFGAALCMAAVRKTRKATRLLKLSSVVIRGGK